MTDAPHLLLRGGLVVDGPGSPGGAGSPDGAPHAPGGRRLDVEVRDGRVVAIGVGLRAPGATVLHAGGRLVLPGSVDAHSHVGAQLDRDDVQLALLRQGVTTVVTGQDGVGPAPGDGTYASRAFAAIDGAHAGYRGDGVAGLLATHDGTSAVNVATLVPAGTVRAVVMGDDDGAPDAARLAAMVELVRAGLADGAVGLSSGLDYAPGSAADAAELAALCAPVAAAGGVHVSHVRGYEDALPGGVAELLETARRSGVASHVSHLHARPAVLAEVLAACRASAHPVGFDAYPYTRGFTLLGMLLLPREFARRPDAGARLRDPAVRAELAATWHVRHLGSAEMGSDWAERMTIASGGDPDRAALEGRTIAEAARAAGVDDVAFAYELLGGTDLATTVVVRVPGERGDDELADVFRQPEATFGSDGIVVGGHPHPRASGAAVRLLRVFALESGDLTLAEAVAVLATRAVDRFGLGDRGRVRVGAIADLALVDPVRLRDRATYADPTALAEGVDDVLVAGVPVLRHGALTGAAPGRGLRRSPVSSTSSPSTVP